MKSSPEAYFFQIATDLLCIVALDGTIQCVNPAFEQALGYNNEELLNQPLWAFVDADERASTQAKLAQLASEASEGDFETRYCCKDGTWKWLAWRAIVILETAGIYVWARDITHDRTKHAPGGQIGPKRDRSAIPYPTELLDLNHRLQQELDERNRIEAALRISQQRFSGIVEIAEDAIISINAAQNITLFNQGAEKIFGYTASEVLGQPLDLLLPLRSVVAHRLHVQDFGEAAYRARQMGDRRSIFGRRKDGSEFPAEASISRLELGNEKIFTVILRDITDRQQVERMKDEFISVVSHELRTPLTSIHGSLGMLASGLLSADSPRGKRLLQIAVESTDRLVRLINDILDIERIESGKISMEKQSCYVADLSQQAIEVMQPLADAAGVTLSLSVVNVQLWADPDRILQTLTNLLSNAIKFSASGSTVWLNAEIAKPEQLPLIPETPDALYLSPYTQLLFSVKDQGRGIPADKLDKIFERFQQVDASDSRNHEGTGLGLAICRSIVQQHSGQIWVNSTLGEGSTFYFTLPLSHLDEFPLPDVAPTGALVLVCDDDPSIRAVLKTLLEQHNYQVITVANGQDAIAQAIAQRPDVILLDLLMPKMNGWQVLAVLREQPETQDIPILICSICPPSTETASDLGFVDWVGKPLDESALFQSLRQALATPAKQIRVLVIEDDADLAQVLRTLFEQQGIDTFHASTGREAIRLSQQLKPDLLVLDLGLPGGDGFTVVDWLRQHNILHSVPLVIYSAKDLNEADRDRLRLGQTEFLTKGRVTPQEFEHRVMGLLQRMTQRRKGG
ncbi:MAG: response regulator [Scytolyngbya sp. HA4215-MV1]|jgi:PAS domain S-box-containing protein|nr:response regulator [Scytolyngbya sp. HA4215-MV1]